MSYRTCLDCGLDKVHCARGLCWRCYRIRKADGTLVERPTLEPSRDNRVGATSEELCAATGISYRQLDHWCRQGYVTADGGVGTGFTRVFPQGEADVVKAMARLVAAGLLPAVAARVARGETELAPGVRILVMSA